MTSPDGTNDYGYDNTHQLTDAMGSDPNAGGVDLDTHPHTTKTLYDAVGNVLTVTDPIGRTTQFVYDNLNRTIEEILPDPDGARPLESPRTYFGYDAVGNLWYVTDPLGSGPGDNAHTTWYRYDALNRQTQVIDALDADPADYRDPNDSFSTSHSTATVYDAAGNVMTVYDPIGHVTKYFYDDLNRMIEERLPDPDNAGVLESPHTYFGYDAVGNLWYETDPLGSGPGDPDHTTWYRYDDLNRQTEVIDALDADPADYRDPNDSFSPLHPTITTYDAAGNVFTVTDPENNTTTFGYDDLDRLSSETNELGDIRDYDYDIAGNLDTTTDRNGRITRYTYDPVRRQIKEEWLEGGLPVHTTEMMYDDAGQLYGVTDDDASYYYQYDGTGNVVRSRMAPADVTQPGEVDLYDGDTLPDDAHDETDANAVFYETEGPDGYITLPLVIDIGAEVIIRVDAAPIGSVSKIALQSPYGIWTEYLDEDADGTILLPMFVNNEQHTTNTTWRLTVYGPTPTGGDKFNLDVLVTPFSSLADFDYSYDDGGNLLTATDSLGATTTYTYDAVHQLDTIVQAGTGSASKSVDFDYLDDGQLLRIQRHSNATFSSLVVTTDYDQYDDIGRLKILKHTFDDNPARSFNYDYAYDAASRITQVNSADGTDDFGYDNTHQLTSAGHFYQTDESYGYDDNGNRDTGGFTVDDNNRMDSDGTYTYAYDDEGNRTQRFIWADDGDGVIEAGEKSSITTYDWDHRNRLTEVTLPGSEVIDYTYDYQNRLVEREMTGGTADHAYYVHQGDNIALELDGLQSGDLTHRYLWGAAVDQLLADDQRGGELLWTLGDHEQTIRSVIDNTGRIRIYRRYDSYGQITQEFKYDASGNIIPDTHAEAVDELFAYTGRMLDKDTGNQKHGQRWYDPPTGGWLSEDPIGFGAGDMNLYRYAGNNPVNNVDPSGLDWSGFSSFMPGFQDYGSSIMFGSTFQSPISGSVPRVDPPPSRSTAGPAVAPGNLGGVQFALAMGAMGANPAAQPSTFSEFPAALRSRKAQIDRELAEYRRTGNVNDEGSVSMAFWKSVLFGGANAGRRIKEIAYTVADLAIGSAEVEINSKVELGLFPEWMRVNLPTLSTAAENIDEHYARGGTYAEAALPGLWRVPANTFTFGAWDYGEGMVDYYETGNPTALHEASGQALLFAGLLRSAPVDGIITPAHLRPVEIVPSPFLVRTGRAPSSIPFRSTEAAVSAESLINFGSVARPEISPTTGLRSYWFRYGDVEHLTHPQIQAIIGDAASAGRPGGANFMRISETPTSVFTKQPPLNMGGVPEYIIDSPVPVRTSIRVKR